MNYARQQKDPTRQSIGFLVVILLHLGLGYAFISGLGHSAIEIIKQPLETKIIEEVKPPDTPPPPPPPKLAPPPPDFMPLPDIQVHAPPAANAITQVQHNVATPAPPPPPKAEVQRTPPVVNASSCRKPEYPAVSKRMEETGTVVVEFLVETDGHVSDSRIAKTSGHPRLDEAARSALSLCSFKPGTVDGKPERSWHQMAYTWKLE